MTEIFKYVFMQNAIIAGLSLGALLAYVGVFVVLKKMSFFGDGIAHASFAGVAAAALMGGNPIIGGIIAALVFALLIFLLEEKFGASGDAAIGIIFTSGMALGLVLIGLSPGYKAELMSFLFGNILAIGRTEAIFSAIMAFVFCALLFGLRRRLGLLALNEELAVAEDKRAKMLKLFFYLITATSVVLGIKILGIILVSAAIIIPASSAKLIAKSFAMLGVFSVVFSEIFISMGLVGSYFLNIGSGSAIVLVGAASFLLIQVSSSLYAALQKRRVLKGSGNLKILV
ncbi:MAG: metal ABC transporter permease [Parcubacteria group bacterium]